MSKCLICKEGFCGPGKLCGAKKCYDKHQRNLYQLRRGGPLTLRKCEACRRKFQPTNRRMRYCCVACRFKAYQGQQADAG